MSNQNLKMDSFILLGQSNMSGRGETSDVEPITNNLCFMLRMGRFQPMSEPVNIDAPISNAPFCSGISLAPAFANCYANETGTKTGLIPCADGGSTILSWMPGQPLFDHAVCQAKLAMRASNLKGILWHQGESDCTSLGNIKRYPARLKTIIEAFRNEVGILDLPVVVGELAYNISDKWILNGLNLEFNKMLANTVPDIKNCALVKAEDLSLKPDGVHFDSRSLRELGIRYYNAYKTIK